MEGLSIKNFREDFIFRSLDNLEFEYYDLGRGGIVKSSVDSCWPESDFKDLANIICFIVFKYIDFSLGLDITNCEWEGRLADKKLKALSDFFDGSVIPVPISNFNYNPYAEAFYQAASSVGVTVSYFPPCIKKSTPVFSSRMNADFLRELENIFRSSKFKDDVRVRLEKTNRCFDKCLNHTKEMLRIRATRILKINFSLLGVLAMEKNIEIKHKELSGLFAVFISKLSKISPERHGVSGYINFSRFSHERDLYFHCILFLDIDFLRTDDYVISFLHDMWLDLARRRDLYGACDAMPVYRHDGGLRYIAGRGPRGLGCADVLPTDRASARYNAKAFRDYLEYFALSNFIKSVKLEPRARLFSTSVLARPGRAKKKPSGSSKGSDSPKPFAEADLSASLI